VTVKLTYSTPALALSVSTMSLIPIGAVVRDQTNDSGPAVGQRGIIVFSYCLPLSGVCKFV